MLQCDSNSSTKLLTPILLWCLRFLGFNEEREVPSLCKSVFDATCYLMEEKLAYSGNEQVSVSCESISFLLSLVFGVTY